MTGLVFQIALKPEQTRIVTTAYGDPGHRVQRLRSDYPRRTAARFTMKFSMDWRGVRSYSVADLFS